MCSSDLIEVLPRVPYLADSRPKPGSLLRPRHVAVPHHNLLDCVHHYVASKRTGDRTDFDARHFRVLGRLHDDALGLPRLRVALLHSG